MIADGMCVGQGILPVDGELRMVGGTVGFFAIIIVKGAVQFEDSVHRRKSEAFGQEGNRGPARDALGAGGLAACCCGEA